jgi:hypothetical protein
MVLLSWRIAFEMGIKREAEYVKKPCAPFAAQAFFATQLPGQTAPSLVQCLAPVGAKIGVLR